MKMMLEDCETLAMFARMRSVDAIVRSALLKQQQQQQQDVITLDDDEELNNVKQKNNTNKRAALDELQRTALHILSLLENDNKTKFHERLSCTSYSPSDTGETHHDDDDEKRNKKDKTRRDYIDVFLKKIFVKAEESGCLRRLCRKARRAFTRLGFVVGDKSGQTNRGRR